MICQDFIKEIGNPQSIYYRAKEPISINSTFNSQNKILNHHQPNLDNHQQFKSTINNLNNLNNIISSSNSAITTNTNNSNTQLDQQNANKLPNNIVHILRMTLDDNTGQFLSISQIDAVIDFYTNEKAKLLSKSLKPEFNSAVMVSSSYDNLNNNQIRNNILNSEINSSNRLTNSQTSPQAQLSSTISSSLLDDPQLKAALNSLMGLKSTLSGNDNQQQQLSNSNDLSNTTNNYVSSLGYNNNAFNNLEMASSSQHQQNTNFISNKHPFHNNIQNRGNNQFRGNKNEFRSTRQSRFN